MQYIGGKYKVAKELAGIISSFKPRVYWEPFVGAGNVIQYVDAPVKIGTDIDRHITSYLECVRDGWLPPAQVSEDDWRALKAYRHQGMLRSQGRGGVRMFFRREVLRGFCS